MKFALKALTFLIISLCLAIAFLVVSIHLAPIEQLKPIIVQTINQATGQGIEISGPLMIKVLPKPELSMEQVDLRLRIGQLDTKIKAHKITANFPWHVFWSNRIKLDNLTLEDFDVLILQNKTTLYDAHFDRFRAQHVIPGEGINISHFSLVQGPNRAQGTLSLLADDNNFSVQLNSKIDFWKMPSDAASLSKLFSFEKVKLKLQATRLEFEKFKLSDSQIDLNYAQQKGDLRLKTKLDNGELTTQGTFKVKSDRVNSLSGDVKYQLGQERYQAQYQIQVASNGLKYNATVLSSIFEGQLNSKFEYDLKTNKLQTHLKLENANATQLMNWFKPNQKTQGGILRLDLKGQSELASIQRIINSFKGHALIHIQNMNLLNHKIDTRYVDVFALLFKNFKRQDNITPIQCIALRTTINQGQCDFKNSLGIETRDLIMVGGGLFNIPSQQLLANIQMKPRRETNLEIGAFSSDIVIKGPLNDLKVTSNSQAALLQEGGTIAVGMATGGVSLLAEKLFKIASKNQSPCKTVLERSN